MKGPDHASSLSPKELVKMIKLIRLTELILDQRKKVSKSEKKNISIARKSLFASKILKKEKNFLLKI